MISFSCKALWHLKINAVLFYPISYCSKCSANINSVTVDVNQTFTVGSKMALYTQFVEDGVVLSNVYYLTSS